MPLARQPVGLLIASVLLVAPAVTVAQTQATGTPQPDSQAEEIDRTCLEGFLETGSDYLTLGEMRLRCRLNDEGEIIVPSLAEERRVADRATAARPFALLAHRPNYILGAAWNQRGWNDEPYQLLNSNFETDDVEIQFQLSFKFPLAIDLFDKRMDIYAAYTNRSFWQAYNSENSEPFRETNHEPELWAQFHNDWEVLGMTNVLNAVGFAHQSNGRSDPVSRSWDRFYANFLFERDGFVLSVKPWLWISREREESDNPDIDDFMGHGEVRAAWSHRGHVFSGMVRNQLESGFERGAVEASWSFPVPGYPYLKGYFQYFYGYGESLIDYNQRVNRFGIGVSVTDWLD